MEPLRYKQIEDSIYKQLVISLEKEAQQRREYKNQPAKQKLDELFKSNEEKTKLEQFGQLIQNWGMLPSGNISHFLWGQLSVNSTRYTN